MMRWQWGYAGKWIPIDGYQQMDTNGYYYIPGTLISSTLHICDVL